MILYNQKSYHNTFSKSESTTIGKQDNPITALNQALVASGLAFAGAAISIDRWCQNNKPKACIGITAIAGTTYAGYKVIKHISKKTNKEEEKNNEQN